MVISISYLPSNAVSAYISSQAQTGAASQNATTQTDPLVASQSTSTTQQTDTAPISSASVITQLSIPGLVKSTLADLKDQAVALKSISKSPNISDFQVIVQGFAQTFNSISKSLKELASKQSAPSTDNRPVQALNDVSKATAGTNTLTSLQTVGITPQANGTLSIDKNQLAKSYQNNPSETLATISNLANRVAQAADKNLSSNATNSQTARREADAQASKRANDAQIASSTTDTPGTGNTTGLPFSGNAVEPQPPAQTTETHATAIPLPDNAASDAIINKQVDAAIDKKVNGVSTPVSPTDDTVSPTNTKSVAQSNAETHSQQPDKPSSPVQSSPAVQTPAPVSNTAHAAVAAYTSVAAI